MFTNYGGEDGEESIGEQGGAQMLGSSPGFEPERGSPIDASRLVEVADAPEVRVIQPSSLPRIREHDLV